MVNVAAGDLGSSAAKKYDIEGWLPGQDKYRELTSCSNTTDYQARRLQARVRRADGKVETLHTLNGTATAIGRTLIALLENHQQRDGSVQMPKALHPYLPERAKLLEPKVAIWLVTSNVTPCHRCNGSSGSRDHLSPCRGAIAPRRRDGSPGTPGPRVRRSGRSARVTLIASARSSGWSMRSKCLGSAISSSGV